MKILGYKGVSLVSRLIRFQTRSEYSHIGVMLDDGSVIEAWMTGMFSGKVRHIPGPFVGHNLDTPIVVFSIKSPFNEERAEAYLLEQVGQKYDTWNVLRFVSRRKAVSNLKKFCSELAMLGLREGGKRVLNVNPSLVSPGVLLMSTDLIEVGVFKI